MECQLDVQTARDITRCLLQIGAPTDSGAWNPKIENWQN